jgi:hypothetical protein
MTNHLLEIRDLAIDAFNYATLLAYPTEELAELAFQAQLSVVVRELALRSLARRPESPAVSRSDASSGLTPAHRVPVHGAALPAAGRAVGHSDGLLT